MPEPRTRVARVPPVRRSYESDVRRRHAEATRTRIIDAAVALHHGSSVRDWRALTISAVAERAGVSERTVYRQFGGQQGLRDAVMGRLERDAGVELDGLSLDGLPELATKVLRHVATYPLEPRPPLEPTLSDARRRQQAALLAALGEQTAAWPEAERVAAAAAIDVVWSVSAYERVVEAWKVDGDRAAETLAWVIGLVVQAIRDGDRPG